MMRAIYKLCRYVCVIFILSTSRLNHLKEFCLEIPSFWTLTWLKSNQKYTGFNVDLTASKVDTYWDINLRCLKTLKRGSKAHKGFAYQQNWAVSILVFKFCLVWNNPSISYFYLIHGLQINFIPSFIWVYKVSLESFYKLGLSESCLSFLLHLYCPWQMASVSEAEKCTLVFS